MKKYIDVTKEVRQKAMKTFKVSEKTVLNALYFDPQRGDSDKAKRIRSFALQNGGVPMVNCKEVETLHDADGYLRQYFPNMAMIEINKTNGNLTAYHRGQKIMRCHNLKVKELNLVQEIVSAWTDSSDIMSDPALYKKLARLVGAE